MHPESRDIQIAPGDDKRMRRQIGTIGLLFTAVGSIIGSSWLFSSMTSAELAGPAAILSWVIAAVMFIFVGLTFSELGTMFPHSGGVARYPHYSHGSLVSFSIGWVTWIATAAIPPSEVLAVVQYSRNYLPWIQTLKDGVPVLTTPGIAVSIALLAVFTLVNYTGVRWFARINNALVWWKLLIITILIIALVAVSFNGAHFTSYGGFAPDGVEGVFAAVSTGGVALAYVGFRQGVELAGETKNPRRNVPLTVLGSLVLCGVLFTLVQMAFIGAVPSSAIAKGGWAHVGENFSSATATLAQFGPLAAIASIAGLTWLAVLLYVDAIVSPADTGLIFTGVAARLSYAMGRNRTVPRQVSSVNRRGVPWIGLVLAFVTGCALLLPFPGWQKLVGFITSAAVLSYGSGPCVLLALRRNLPQRHRPFRVPLATAVSFLALWSSNLVVYWTGWEQVRLLMAITILGLVLFAVNQAVALRHAPRVDIKHGWWVLSWFAGLCLISYLGPYGAAGDPTKSVGNLGVLGTWSGLIATGILAAITLLLARHLVLPTELTERVLQERQSEEQSEAGATV